METVSDAPEKVDFFISYAGVERAWAEWVAWHLQQHGFSVEFDHQHWRAGDNTTVRMSDALTRADRFLALLSPSYFERRRYTWDEWTAAFDDRERPPRGFVPLHVAALEKSQIPALLRPIKAGILHGKGEEEALAELLHAVGGPQAPTARPEFPEAVATAGAGDRPANAPRLPEDRPAAWNVPQRLPLFTGRDEVLDRIRTVFRLSSGTRVQALHGMGGVGKTQTAAEYCYRFASQYDVVWWLDAQTTVTLDSQLADLAHALGTLPATMPVGDAAQSARQYLRTNGRWLLVLDNAEDPETFRSLLPDGDGHVLITSRDPGWHSLAAPVDLGLFAREESRALLAGYVPQLPEGEADRLAESLGDLPLALAQAGGLIATSGFSVDTYLKDLTATSRLLDRSAPITYQHKTLGAAVRLSSEHLARTDPVASEILRVCAFLAPEPIPLDAWVTKTGVTLPPPLDRVAGDPVAVADAITEMVRLGLVRPQHGGLTIHRLTAAILRDHPDPENATDAHTRAKDLITGVRPDDEGRDPETWQEWAGILPHVLALSEAWTQDEAMRRLSLDATRYLLVRGTTTAALDTSRELHRRWSAPIGESHPDVLSAATMLTDSLNSHGSYREALTLVEGAVELSRAALGEDHKETLAAQTALATTLTNLGQYRRAQSIEEETLERCRATLGETHRDTLTSGNNLAVTLSYLGRYHEARALKEEVLRLQRGTLGPSHPDTLTSAANLASTLNDLGRHADARTLIEDTLGRCRATLGDDHSKTLFTTQHLAAVLASLGQHHKALELQQEVLDRQRKTLGEEHPSTLTSASNLAATLSDLGRMTQARVLLQETLVRSRTTLGIDHPRTLQPAHTLATCLGRLGQYVQARALLQETRDRCRVTLGEDHPHTLTAGANLAMTLNALGRRKEAKALTQRTLEGFRRTLGEEHPQTVALAQELAGYKKVFGKRKRKPRR